VKLPGVCTTSIKIHCRQIAMPDSKRPTPVTKAGNTFMIARMKTCALFLLIILVRSSSFACINIVGTKYNGERGSSGRRSGIYELQHAIMQNPQPDGVKMEAELRGSTNFTDRSDYSVALMFLGRNREAVQLLESLEKEKPGEFYVAGNLGTAYELCGENESALHWIKEEIKRDPDAHEGTEWLHVKILEAKIAHSKDPDYFKKHTVLELNPDQIPEQTSQSVRSNDFDLDLPAYALSRAIEHQLSERLKFVKPPDEPIASLLFDYAALEARTKTLESAKGVLQMALDYGYPPDQVRPLMKAYDQKIFWRKFRGYFVYVIPGLLAIGLLYSLYRRGVFVLSNKTLKRK
jgi:tetratricopeptide (TPR) repeat protein